MPQLTSQQIISALELARHPEGGWFRESYRSGKTVPAAALPEGFPGPRAFCTSIYFLLERGDISALHRIRSDELWHFHAGATLTVHAITPCGERLQMPLGSDLASGSSFQAMVPAGCWFGAEVTGIGDYSLVGCTVSPGFDFEDFDMGNAEVLLRQYPQHADVIRRLARNG